MGKDYALERLLAAYQRVQVELVATQSTLRMLAEEEHSLRKAVKLLPGGKAALKELERPEDE